MRSFGVQIVCIRQIRFELCVIEKKKEEEEEEAEEEEEEGEIIRKSK